MITYPNLIFINQVFDKYLFGRVERTDATEALWNALATSLGKANNLPEVLQKLRDLSEKCSVANVKQDEVENAIAWVNIIIDFGEVAFLLGKHNSYNTLHMLRTYLLQCAESWPELAKQIHLRVDGLNAQLFDLEKSIEIKVKETKSPSKDATEANEESKEVISNNANTSDKYAVWSLKAVRELRESIIRKLVYLGFTKVMQKETDIGVIFPLHASLFSRVKTLPRELQPNYYIDYCTDVHNKTLSLLITDLVNEHNFKYGTQQPGFLNPVQTKQILPNQKEKTVPDEKQTNVMPDKIGTRSSSFNPGKVSLPIPIPTSPTGHRNTRTSNLFSLNSLQDSSFIPPSIVSGSAPKGTGISGPGSTTSSGEGRNSNVIVQAMLDKHPSQTGRRNDSLELELGDENSLIEDKISDVDSEPEISPKAQQTVGSDIAFALAAANNTNEGVLDSTTPKPPSANEIKEEVVPPAVIHSSQNTAANVTSISPSPKGRKSPTHFQPPPQQTQGEDTTANASNQNASQGQGQKKKHGGRGNKRR